MTCTFPLSSSSFCTRPLPLTMKEDLSSELAFWMGQQLDSQRSPRFDGGFSCSSHCRWLLAAALVIFGQHSLVDALFFFFHFLLPHGTFSEGWQLQVDFFLIHKCSNYLLKLCRSVEKKLLPTQAVDTDLLNNESMFSCTSQHFLIHFCFLSLFTLLLRILPTRPDGKQWSSSSPTHTRLSEFMQLNCWAHLPLQLADPF